MHFTTTIIAFFVLSLLIVVILVSCLLWRGRFKKKDYKRSEIVVDSTRYFQTFPSPQMKKEPFILAVQWYQPKTKDRQREIEYCFSHNFNDNKFSLILVFFETEQDQHRFPWKNDSRVISIVLSERMTFYDIFHHLTPEIQGILFIANTDIVFDAETIENVYLLGLDQNRACVCLTRFECDTRYDCSSIKVTPRWSQDAWIFHSRFFPYLDHKDSSIPLGVPACDNLIATYFYQKQFHLINVPEFIKIGHVHQSNYRTYQQKDRLKGQYIFVEPTSSPFTGIRSLRDIYKTASYQSKYLVVTVAIMEHSDFVEAYDYRTRELDCPWRLIVLCTDDESYHHFASKQMTVVRLPCHDVQYEKKKLSSAKKGSKNTVTRKFYALGYVVRTLSLLEESYDIVYTDTDMFVFQDFMPWIDTHSNSSVQFWYQGDSNTTPSQGKEIPCLCPGFFLMKNEASIVPFLEGCTPWKERKKSKEAWFFKSHLSIKNEILSRVVEGCDQHDQTYFHRHKDQFQTAILPRHLFPKEMVFSQIPKQAFLFHYNCLRKPQNEIEMRIRGHLLSTDFFSQKTMEQAFAKMIRERFREIPSAWKYMPVPWTFLQKNKMSIEKSLEAFSDESSYFTIIQHDKIPVNIEKQGNIHVFCAGSAPKTHSRYTILPLISKVMNVVFPPVPVQKTYMASYLGSDTHPVRRKMIQALKNYPDVFLKDLGSWKSTSKSDQQWKDYVFYSQRSRFVLAPRGYGPTSFRFYEVLEMGVVPVFIYDDEQESKPFLPYRELLDWDQLCISCPISDIHSLHKRLQEITDPQYTAMLQNYQQFRSLFKMSGIFDYIISTLSRLKHP